MKRRPFEKFAKFAQKRVLFGNWQSLGILRTVYLLKSIISVSACCYIIAPWSYLSLDLFLKSELFQLTHGLN